MSAAASAGRFVRAEAQGPDLRPIALPPAELGRPIRVAVINNPRSRFNSREDRLHSIQEILRRADTPFGEADTLDDLVELTQALVQDGAELIVVNGGDGTVHGVLTGLGRLAAEGPLPMLAVLPGGTTNTTARNLGYAARPEEGLREILAHAQAGALRGWADPRPSVCVDRGDGEPLYAMMFGAGGVYHGIRFAKQYVESSGARGQLGAGIALAVFLARLASGRGGTLFPPLASRAAVDGEWGKPERLIGLLASTMNRQFLGLEPYWGEGPGPLRYSTIAYSPKHLMRAAIPVMRGRPNRFVRPENGYLSVNAHRVELELDSGFTLDGELYPPQPGTSVHLSTEQPVYFLRRSKE